MKIGFNLMKIQEYEEWILYLHENQSLLGRVYLMAKRKNAVDFIKTSVKERDEFFYLAGKINKSLENLFQPDLMNYASLGNRFRHLHVHFIPRYKSEREFDGVLFVDKKWGMNYAPYDMDFEFSKSNMINLRDLIKNELIRIM